MTHIQQRRDQSAIWTLNNPVLFDGEMGWEKDTGKGKMGDGVTPWNALPYLRGVDSVGGKTGAINQLDFADVKGVAPLESPQFTGSPSTPTPAWGDNDRTIANTEFVQRIVADAIKKAKLDLHPVSSIYFSEANVNPTTFIGGTWVAWGSGRVPVGVDPADVLMDTPGETGGAESFVMTKEQMAAHDHGGSTGGESNTHVHAQYVSSDAAAGPAVRLDYVSDSPTASGAAYPQGITTDGQNTGHTHPVVSDGLNQPISIMQPYITCYMFKRTA